MFTKLFPIGSSHFREHRMLRENTPEGPSGNLPGVDTLNTFFTSVTNRVEKLLNREGVRNTQTAAKLADSTRWLQAFGQTGIFEPTATVRDRNTLGSDFGPLELLSTMPVQERMQRFYEFTRAVIPPGVINTHPEFANPGFRESMNNLLVAGTLLSVPNDAERTTILNVAALLLGTQNTVPGRVQNIAREAFSEIYPANNQGRIYQDYLQQVERVRKAAGSNPAAAPSNANLRSRTFLIERLSLISTSTFLGYLKVGDPLIVQARLDELADQRERRLLSGEEDKLKIQLQYENLNEKVKKDAANLNTSYLSNLSVAYELNPVATGLAVGLVGYGLWRMLRSKNPFLRAVPYGLGATYAYLALRGDPSPLNTMLGNAETFGKTIAGGLHSVLHRGLLPPTITQQDQKTIALMTRFANEKAFLSATPIVVPMAAAGGVPVNMYAGNAFQANFDPATGQISYRLYAEPTDPLYLSVQKIIKERGYSQNTLHLMMFEHNAQIAEAIGNVFYHLAAREPGNAIKAKRIEAARQTSGSFGMNDSLSYRNIRDPQIMGDYFDLITRGRNLAITQYPGRSLQQIVEMLMTEETAPSRPDFAERLPVPGTGGNNTRSQERNLYASRNVPLTPDRKTSIEAIRNSFGEFVDHWSAPLPAPNRQIMQPDAAKHLREFVEALLAGTQPLPDVLFAVQRIRYAILVAATVRSGTSPLSIAEMRTLLGQVPGGADAPGTISEILGSITNWINREVGTLSSSFQNVNDLSNVQAVLQQRMFSGVESGPGGLKRLQDQLGKHRARFNQMRSPAEASEQFIQSLPPATVARFGNTPDEQRKNLSTFIQRLVAMGSYRDFLNDTERSYAHQVMEGVLEAQMTTHVGTGLHALDMNVSDRWISPTEEQNLMDNNDWLLRQMIGTPDRPMNGMLAAMGMRQLLSDFTPGTMDARDETQRWQSVGLTQRLAWLYLFVQPINQPPVDVPVSLPMGAVVTLPIDAVTVHLRTRLRTLGRAFVAQVDAAIKAGATPAERLANVQALQKTQSFSQGIPDIISTMNLIGMTDAADAALIKRLGSIRVLGASDMEEDEKVKKAKEDAEKKKAAEEALKKLAALPPGVVPGAPVILVAPPVAPGGAMSVPPGTPPGALVIVTPPGGAPLAAAALPPGVAPGAPITLLPLGLPGAALTLPPGAVPGAMVILTAPGVVPGPAFGVPPGAVPGAPVLTLLPAAPGAALPLPPGVVPGTVVVLLGAPGTAPIAAFTVPPGSPPGSPIITLAPTPPGAALPLPPTAVPGTIIVLQAPGAAPTVTFSVPPGALPGQPIVTLPLSPPGSPLTLPPGTTPGTTIVIGAPGAVPERVFAVPSGALPGQPIVTLAPTPPGSPLNLPAGTTPGTTIIIGNPGAVPERVFAVPPGAIAGTPIISAVPPAPGTPITLPAGAVPGSTIVIGLPNAAPQHVLALPPGAAVPGIHLLDSPPGIVPGGTAVMPLPPGIVPGSMLVIRSPDSPQPFAPLILRAPAAGPLLIWTPPAAPAPTVNVAVPPGIPAGGALVIPSAPGSAPGTAATVLTMPPGAPVTLDLTRVDGAWSILPPVDLGKAAIEVQTQMKTMQTDLNALDKSVGGLPAGKPTEALQNDVKGIRARLDALEKQRTELEQRINDGNQPEAKKILGAIREEVTKVQTEITALQKRIKAIAAAAAKEKEDQAQKKLEDAIPRGENLVGRELRLTPSMTLSVPTVAAGSRARVIINGVTWEVIPTLGAAARHWRISNIVRNPDGRFVVSLQNYNMVFGTERGTVTTSASPMTLQAFVGHLEPINKTPPATDYAVPVSGWLAKLGGCTFHRP